MKKLNSNFVNSLRSYLNELSPDNELTNERTLSYVVNELEWLANTTLMDYRKNLVFPGTYVVSPNVYTVTIDVLEKRCTIVAGTDDFKNV